MAFDFEKFGTPVKTASGSVTGARFNFDSFGQEAEAPQKKRGTLGKVAEFLAPTATHTVDKLRAGEQVEGKDIVGSALEIGSFAIPAGAGARALGLAGKAAIGLRGAGLAGKIAEGGAAGAISGAMAEAGRGIGEGQSAGDVAKRAGIGAAIGAPIGGAIPAVGSAIGRGVTAYRSGLASKAAKTAEEAALLESKTPDSRVATKMLAPEPEVPLAQAAAPDAPPAPRKVVNDPKAEEVVRQGVPEADVALIKSGSPKDVSKMKTMLETRVKQLTNKRITDRATDTVGDTFLERIAKPLSEKNKEAGKALNLVAQRLAGKKANPAEAVSQFAADLDSKGVKVGKDGKLDFKGSDFEGLRGPQVLIENVWRRALKAAKSRDALQIHRTKSYIDEIVEYGKSAEGLSGKAQTLLKSFRHNMDQVLDTKFPEYNRVNTVFADTINELSKISEAMGRRFRIGDSFADARAGLVMRRILSNTQSRSDVLQLLESSQAVLKKHGIELDEDIITQANFADTLERILGSEAPTSFLGQIERGTKGVEEAVDIGTGLLSGSIGGTLKAGGKLIEKMRGIDRVHQIQALRDLLEQLGPTAKKPSVFGKPKK